MLQIFIIKVLFNIPWKKYDVTMRIIRHMEWEKSR